MRRLALMGGMAALAAACNCVNAAEGDSLISGVWMTTLESEITIAACEDGHCGYLSKILIPEAALAENRAEIEAIGVENLKDYMNKDPELRERPLLGLQILTLDVMHSPILYEGEVYNPEDGNTYYGKLELVDDATVRLTGCGFFNLICKSEDWVRTIPEDEATGLAAKE